MKIKSFSLLFLLLANILFSAIANANDNQAYQIKAAYLYQFFKYTDWSNSTKAKTIGIVSNENLKGYFSSIEGKLFYEQRITIHSIKNIDDALHCCNMLYFAPDTELQLQQWSKKMTNGVVIVADESLKNGELSMIQLHKKGTKLKFIINTYNTRAKNVDLSSRLLRVAIKVNTKT